MAVLLSNIATSQVFERPSVPPVVSSSGVPFLNPFVGGFESPIVQLVDLDGDGDLDIAATDRDKTIRVFERVLAGPTSLWTAAAEPLPDVRVTSWFRFADLDGDGDQDLFTGGASSGVFELKNVGSGSHLLLDPRPRAILDVNGLPVINEVVNVPAFADPDGDGDLDFFAGNSAGSIVYYENIGTSANPMLQFVTNAYQGITIIGFGGARPDSEQTRTLHGAMAIDFGDLDADGDLDILWGDFFSPSLYLLRNDGSSTNPMFMLVDSTFPDSYPAISSGLNAPTLGDIDADGDLDMLVSVASGFESTHNLFVFRNQAGAAMADLRLDSRDPLNVLDIGSTSRPVVGDVTGDGLDDIVVAEGGGSVRLLRGMPVLSGPPVFDLQADTLISLLGQYILDPSICDLDGDGTNEIMIGDFSGRLRLYKLSGSWQEDTTFQLRGLTLGQSISPDIADVDNDGDQDLVLGFGNGRLALYENTGSGTVPVFTLRSGFFDNVSVGNDAVPFFYDLNADGAADLILGSRNDGLRLWIQYNGGFYPYSYAFGDGEDVLNGAPAVMALNGEEYLLYGQLKGGLNILQRTTRQIPPLGGPTSDHPFPNPASEKMTIRFLLPVRQRTTISMVDLLGREVLRVLDADRGPGYLSETFSVRELASGVYVVWIRAGESRAYPIVVVR